MESQPCRDFARGSAVSVLFCLSVLTIPVEGQQEACVLDLPDSEVCFTVFGPYPPGTDSFSAVDLTNVPPGSCSVSNSPPSYRGWCFEACNYNLQQGFQYCGATLRSSTDPLPAHLESNPPLDPNLCPDSGQPIPWGKINYILNHKADCPGATPQDVQAAIWYLTDGAISDGDQNFTASLSAGAQCYTNAATGQENFMPGPGQVVAVLLDLGEDSTVQRTFIELTCCSAQHVGCRVTGGSNHQTNTFQAACITTPVPTRVSHGGQVGAPFSVGTPFTPNSLCISGEWQHNRHLQGNSLVGNFHASGNGNEHQFDSLLCACLPCDENPDAVGVVGELCNPGDRICGPEPRRAPANKICFSGVGDYTFTTGNKTVKAVFRVDIEDRSEGNSQSSSPPPDRYRIRLWLLDPSCGRNPDPNSAEAMTLRFAASADPATIANLATTEQLKVNIQPDIDDGGDMTQGNHQIHPETGSQCSMAIPAPIARVDVATEIACLTPSGVCAFALVAQGYQGLQDPAFVYRVTITNSGTVNLTNLSVIEAITTTEDTTGQYFAPGATLPPGGSITRYCTNTWGTDTIKMVTVSGSSAQNGEAVFTASAAMASVAAAEVTCNLTLYSPCDLDGNANDNHLQLPGSNCLVRSTVQVCNMSQVDLTGVTVNDNWLNCPWPAFDLPKGACTNISCTTTQSCPGVAITPQVTVTGTVRSDCSHGASRVGGASITVSSACSGRVEGCQAAAGPTGLTVAPVTGGLSLKWKALSGATSYKVKRATISGGPYTTIRSGLTKPTFKDTTVARRTVYYYVVSAIKGGVETANSAQASGKSK